MQMFQGFSDWRHITTKLFEYEKSYCHKHSPDAYFLNACVRSIKQNLLKKQFFSKNQQVLQRRFVLKCVIDVILCIGFQVLPYCSKRREVVETVFDESNHDNGGNFLEAINFFAEYNPLLQEHLQWGKSGRAMGQIGTATTFITHARIKAVLLEKEELSNQLYIQL